LQSTNELDAIGPILLGMRKSLHVLQLGASVREILSMIKIAVIDAQSQDK
jgi:malate dehydrogenase (oxaloacetate-decarboxylating)(NADP+)